MIIFFKKIHNESQPSSKFSKSLMNVVDVFVFRLRVKKNIQCPIKIHSWGGGLLNLKEIIHFKDFKRKCVENLLTQQSSNQNGPRPPPLLHSVGKMRFYPPPQKKCFLSCTCPLPHLESKTMKELRIERELFKRI